MSHFSKYSRVAGVAVVLSVLAADPVFARPYTIQALEPFPGGISSIALVSRNGVVAGSATTSDGVSHSCIWKNGVIMQLPETDAPGVNSAAYQITSNNDVFYGQNVQGPSTQFTHLFSYNLGTGVRTTVTGVPVDTGVDVESVTSNSIGQTAFTLYSGNRTSYYVKNGVAHEYPAPAGAAYVEIHGLNKSGQMIGETYTPKGRQYMLWQDSQIVANYGDFGVKNPWVTGINDKGDVLVNGDNGDIVNNGQLQPTAYLWSNGALRKIENFSGQDWISGVNLNNNDWIVGKSGVTVVSPGFSTYVPKDCFVWHDGYIADLADLLPADSGWVLDEVIRINDQNEILGSGLFHGTARGFVMRPAAAPAPSVTSITPAIINHNSSATLTIYGNNFEAESKVSFNNGPLVAAHYVSPQMLTVSVPASVLALVGQYSVHVETPAPGGGASANLPLTVVSSITIFSVTPGRIDPGAANVTITVMGTNFAPGVVVTINDTYTVTPTVLSPTKLTAMLPSSVTGTAGAYFVRVVNPAKGDYSGPLRLLVASATPVISSLSPDRIGIGLANLSLYVYGTGFTAGSRLSFNGAPSIVPTSVQANRLVVSIPASILAQNGTYPIRIVNSLADGGMSEPKNFVVSFRPALTAITPGMFKTSASSVTLTLTGANFEPGSVVKINDTTAVTPTFVSSTKLTIVLPGAVSSTPGSYFARVVNPGYANNSAPKGFVVTAK
ncbi:MAG: IPT/TIG domain-containing protein [Capsulimonas sp.]|uniref:IPT/TIG domain-containing protein n=1 Tax=Capsulimonas sp. TaxID=2494211 RepID=UPI003263B552